MIDGRLSGVTCELTAVTNNTFLVLLVALEWYESRRRTKANGQACL
jgi:hypothetical protein